MDVKNKDLIEMFGTETNKKTYKRTKKIDNKTKNNLLYRARKKYSTVVDLGRGRYIIDKEFTEEELKINEEKRKIMKRRANYDFVNYDNKYDHLKGVYCIIYENEIYIGSTIASFRERSSSYNSNLKSENRNKDCNGDYLIKKGGKMQILWSTDIKNEEKIRLKEIEYIDYYTLNTSYDVVNFSHNVSILNKDKQSKKKKLCKFINILVREEDYEKAMDILVKNKVRLKLK